MGDKAAARKLAASLGIPIPAGYDDADQSDEALTDGGRADRLPAARQAAAGGGGKGMRTVRDPDRLATDLAAARREAQAAFSDDRLILERLVEGARHVEIQVLFDGRATASTSGSATARSSGATRRSSRKRPPPPSMPTCARMGEAALTLAGAVGYVSAGTCEFLLDDRGRSRSSR